MPKTYKDYVQSIYEAMADPNVAKGVGEYIKIGADKIKTHPSFRDMFKKMGKGYLQTTGPKYIKIWDTERGQKRSIAAFIDKVSGDVLNLLVLMLQQKVLVVMYLIEFIWIS